MSGSSDCSDCSDEDVFLLHLGLEVRNAVERCGGPTRNRRSDPAVLGTNRQNVIHFTLFGDTRLLEYSSSYATYTAGTPGLLA
jgi:hypothetical protein